MNGFFGFILLVGGIIAAASPQTTWYLSIGWKFKDAEPSDAALTMQRVSGMLAALVGFIIIVSSCSSMFAGSPDAKWEKQFQQRIVAGEVTEISFGMIGELVLTDEERNEVIDFIKDAQFQSFDTGGSYGASGLGSISFQNGDKIDLVLFGNSGGIELHPNGMQNAFKIESAGLEIWIRNHVLNRV